MPNLFQRKHNRMPKKSKKKKHFTRWQPGKLLAIAASVLVIGAAIVLYAFQPNVKRLEINRLARVYVQGGSHIGLFQLAKDIWTVYLGGKELVPCAVKPDDNSPLFGGMPRTKQLLTILKNDAYWVGYSEEKRAPLWAAYRLLNVENDEKPANRAESFQPDRRTAAQVTSDQYTNSGYDRGHLASNYSIAKCYGSTAQMQTFLMSNVVPQRHALNAGIWKSLEMKEINSYTLRCQSIWIIAGPIYPDVITQRLPSGIPVPEAFYKIILDEIDGRIRAMAFIFDHDMEKNTDLSACLVSIDEIERRTGLDFFPSFPEEVQSRLEAITASGLW